MLAINVTRQLQTYERARLSIDTLKIYLDQKDYSRIARALAGDTAFQGDLKVFEHLKSRVTDGRIVVYFSWCHIVEAMRYDKDHTALLEPYCEAVDTLTEGNCIVFPDEITARELELLLAKHFSFTPRISEATYAFGKYQDAVVAGWVPEETGHAKLKDIIEQLPLSGQKKKGLYRNLSKPKNLAKFIREQSSDTLQLIRKQYPGTEKLSVDEIVEMLIGSRNAREKAYSKLFNQIMRFKNLVAYSHVYPDLKNLGDIFNATAENLVVLIRRSQLLQGLLNKSPIDEFRLNKQLRDHFIEQLIKKAKPIAQTYALPMGEVGAVIRQSAIGSIPSISAAITAAIEYAKRHKGDLKLGRKPLESDIMDIHHLRNLPYVDVYLTDRFFAEVGRKGQQIFKTTVLRNLTELEMFLSSAGSGD